MAKLNYELQDFVGGTITNADYQDIPDGASAYSLNVSPMGKMGGVNAVKTDLEIMGGYSNELAEQRPGIPPMSSMIVRDAFEGGAHNLAVNIRNNFIYIPNYRNDSQLGNFVEVAEKGQLYAEKCDENIASHTTKEFCDNESDGTTTHVHSSNPGSKRHWNAQIPNAALAANPLVSGGNYLGVWNTVDSGGWRYYYSVIPTVPTYLYTTSTYYDTTLADNATFGTGDEAAIYMLDAKYDSNGDVLAYNNTAHWAVPTDSRRISKDTLQLFTGKSIKRENFTALSDYSVVVLRAAHGSTSENSYFSGLRAEFYKGGYLWGALGENLDFTDTENGLFIGSSTTKPRVLHQARDDKNRTLDYLELSECKPTISANALANVDFMKVLKAKDDSGSNINYLAAGVYGQRFLWLLSRNYGDAGTGSLDFTDFIKSNEITWAPNGLAGLIEDNDSTHAAPTYFSWEFEGANIYKGKMPTNLDITNADATTPPPAFTTTLEATYSIDLEILPEDGYIAGMVHGINDTDKMYVLLDRDGGIRCDDNVLLEVDISSGGIKTLDDGVQVLYKALNYTHITAYKDFAYIYNWLGVRDDVAPKSATDFYWTTESGVEATPSAYVNGRYGDLGLGNKFGFIEDMCWMNTDKDDVSLDVQENAIICNTIDDDGTDKDMITFSIAPLGETGFLKNSGVYRNAKQWPNNWPNWGGHDGSFTYVDTKQTISKDAQLVSVMPTPDFSITEDFSPMASGQVRMVAQLKDVIQDYHDDAPLAGSSQSWPAIVWPPGLGIAGGMFGSLNNFINSAQALLNMRTNPDYLELYDLLMNNGNTGTIIDKCKALRDDVFNMQSGWLWSLIQGAFELSFMVNYGLFFPIGGEAAGNYWSSLDVTSPFRRALTSTNTFFGTLFAVSLLHTSSKVQAYNTLIQHTPISSAFPMQGGFNGLHARPNNANQFYMSKLNNGVVDITTAAVSFSSGSTAKEKMQNMTFTCSDTIGTPTTAGGSTTNVKNDNSKTFQIKENVFQTTMDSSGNITRVDTGDKAEITEYVIEPVYGAFAISNSASAHGGSAMALIPSSKPGFISAHYTGDLLIRSYAEDDATLNDWHAAPFDSGDASVGIKPVQGTDTASDDLVKFKEGDTVMYNISYLYDGYQEGPLMGSAVTVKIEDINSFADFKGVLDMNVEVNVGTLNPRITAINLYRKFDANEKYRLVEQIELDNEWLLQPEIANVPDANLSSTAFMQSGISTTVIDTNKTGVSYEALTGMPETLRETIVDYSVSAQVSNYLFVANARHGKIDNANKFIFRSQPGKFSMFNWATDYLGIPEIVHSLVVCYNRLFAFSNKVMYQIDPHNMVIEAEHEGFGILNEKSCCVADGMLYIATKNGVYLFGQGKFKNITNSIQDIWDDTFTTFPNSIPILANDKQYNSLLVMFDNAGTRSNDIVSDVSYSFSIDKRRWDLWEIPSKAKSVTLNEENRLMISAESSEVKSYDELGNPLDANGAIIKHPYAIWELHSGGSDKALTWKSKELTFGENTRNKKFKKLKLIGTNVYVSKVIIDGDETEYAFSDLKFESKDDGTDGHVAYLTLNKVGKKIQVEIKTNTSGNTTGTSIDGISITYANKTLK
jgi:hypothetical protein